MTEKPGASTPWLEVNQLLAPDECFEVRFAHWHGFLLAPKHSSQLAALLYLLHQKGVNICVQGRGNDSFPLAEHTVIVSTRAFSQIIWHEEGVVEVGAGSALSHLHQFLFERNQDVALEEDPLASTKRSIAGLILSGKTADVRYCTESLLDIIVGVEFVTWEGSQVKWGGQHRSSSAGPALYRLIWGLQTFPGVIIKVILKTHPTPPVRLRLAWSFRQRESLWKQFNELKSFSTTWEYLDVVLSGQSADQGFIFAQISGLPEEMEAFSQLCPGYATASQKGERLHLRNFLRQQNLKSYAKNMNYPLEPGEYLWVQNENQNAWLLTKKRELENVSSLSFWKQRFLSSLSSKGSISA